jgi:Amt family ammonium transporter
MPFGHGRVLKGVAGVKSMLPSLRLARPRVGLACRLRYSLAALAVVLVLVVLGTWVGQAWAADADSAPAATAQPALALPGVPTTTMPSYFMGLPAPDPTGRSYGVSPAPSGVFDARLNGDDAARNSDIPAKLSNTDLYNRMIHNTYSLNIIWVLVCGVIVMFMQVGFAMVESGLCRAKNASHTFAMNMMIYPLGCLSFFFYGFALGWGNWFDGSVAPGWFPALGPGLSCLNQGWHVTLGGHEWNVLGTKGFCLQGITDVGTLAYFFFMMVFLDTAATIPTGAMAERWRWSNFCIYGLFVGIPYSIFAGWVWGGGWLAQLGANLGLGNGACDFAGSGVVHCMGGVIALAGCIVIGPRLGRYVHGKPQAIPGHNIPMVMCGTLLLAIGWFGFNAGSTLSGTDLRISVIIVNTMLASVTGAVVAMVVMWLKFGKPDPSIMCNGMLAGLVGITAPCAFVTPVASVFIGAGAGALAVYGLFFLDNVGIDDCVGAISVHGINGVWGVLAVGLFACGDYGMNFNGVPHTVRGLFYGGGFGQLAAQSIEAVVCIVVGFGVMYAFFKISNRFVPVRSRREHEIQGLDLPETGALAYADFELKSSLSYAQSTYPGDSVDRPTNK